METETPVVPVARPDARFFLVMAWVMAATVITGFGLNLFMGRSTFSVPFPYHVHAAVFIAWTALYVTQNTLIFRGSIGLHRRLGKLGFLLIPLMVVLGIWLTLVSLRVRGGPPVFGQAEFLFVNICHILAFAALAAWAVHMRGRTDWHRRLMYGATACVGHHPDWPGCCRSP
ncbi:MAG: hypothetical protein U5K56_17655 [Halioglobus sp.]|nr:hypothetical protein [Halioglobus sp.]